MGRTCRGICEYQKADSVPNRLRYKIGQKLCSFCGIFFSIDAPRCPCCQAALRTKPKSKKSKKVIKNGLH